MTDDNRGYDVERDGVERRTILGTIAAGGFIGGIRSMANGWPDRPDRLEWAFETGDDVVREPAVEDGTVFFGSLDGFLYAVTAETGEESWRYDTGDAVFSSPAVADGTVYLGVRGGGLVAVDAATGEVAWTHDPDGYSVSSPTVADGTVFAGNTAGNLDAVDATSGELKWTYETGGDIVGAPTVDGGTVYVGNRNDSVAAVDATTGEERWVADTDGTVLSPAVDGGTVFAASFGGSLYALDAATGEEAWTFAADAPMFTAVAAGGTVYAGSEGSLYALDAADGTENWTASTRGPIRNYPDVVDDIVYVGGGDTVYALEATSGDERWSFRAENTVDGSSPVVADGTLFVGCEDDRLYAIRTGDGDEGPGEPVEMTGFHPPQIDGVLYGHAGESLPEGKAGEWADADEEAVELVGANADSSLKARLFTKGIGDELYLGILVPPEERTRTESLSTSQLSAIRLYLGRNGNGELSDGDVRFVGRPARVDTETARGIQAVRWHMERFRGGEFVEVDVEGRPVPASAVVTDLENGELGFESRIEAGSVNEVLDDERADGKLYDLNVEFLFEDGPWGVGYDPSTLPSTYELGGRSGMGEVDEIPTDNSGVQRIEVTQSVQDKNNTVTLVQDKETLARVYVDNPEASPITVDVRLEAYAHEGGSWTWIGQQSISGFNAPPTPDREKQADTANFRLPASWRTHSALALSAHVSRPGHYKPSTGSGTPVWLTAFADVEDPNIYVVRVATSSNGRAPQSDLTLAQTGFENISPLGNPNFVNIGSWEFGILVDVDDQDIISELNDYVASRNLWAPPLDQLHGIVSQARGGGLSDPSWASGFLGIGGGKGDGIVSWGSIASSSSALVMAHEINHNIGPGNRLANKHPWGRHVDGGCNSNGTDGSYPVTGGNVGEVGWTPANGVVPTSKPELMTYCSDSNPVKWISKYRWQRQRKRWENWTHPVSLYQLGGAMAAGAVSWAAPTARVISGFLYADEGGQLQDGEFKPSFEIPGTAEFPDPEVEEPQAILEIHYLDRDEPRTVPIEVSFEPLEVDHSTTKRPFTVRVPEEGTPTHIVLRDTATGESLSALEGRAFELTEETGMATPDAFERGETYELSVDVVTEDGFEPPYRRLFYRTRGEDWKPWGRPFTSDSVDVQFTVEPGGEDGQFMLLVSNGLTTRRVVTESFELPPLPPSVELPRGQNWTADIEVMGEEGDGNDDGDEDVDVEVSNVRNVGGPVKATVGGVVSLKVRATDERGVPLSPESLQWTIEDEGQQVAPVGSPVGERLFHRFTRPGTYTVTVTGTDSTTGKTATDDILVEVDDPPLPGVEAVDAFRGDATPTETPPSETPTVTAPRETTSTDASPADDEDGDETPESTPGLGIASALGALGTAGYLLKRRFTGNDDEAE